MPEIAFPYVCGATSARLPRRPQDNQIVCDQEGNLWQYNSDSGSWLNRGTLNSPPLVDETKNGLVTPDVFERLALLKTATNSGRSLPEEIKINPHTGVYWYLFHSSDKLIRFTPEGQNILRMEVDRGRLFTLITGMACRGPKGLTGVVGARGVDGVSAGPEPCFAPLSTTESGRRLNFDLMIPAPLATDISIRLAISVSNRTPVLTILVTPASGSVRLDSVSPTIFLDQTRTLASISYDVTTQRLRGAFILSAGLWAHNCILARQKGAAGEIGDPGACTLKTSECSVSLTDIQFTTPIVAIRKSCDADQLLTMSANLFNKVCVSKLSFGVASPDYGNLFSGGVVTGRTLAVRRTLDACKDFSVYKPDLVTADRPLLELPEWQPQSDCNVSKRAEQSDLNWMPATHVQTGIKTWDIPLGRGLAKYPWRIMITQPSDVGGCDPCVDAVDDVADVPCAGNQVATTTTAMPNLFHLRSHADGTCSCVSADTPTGAGDVVLNTYSTLASCQQGRANICASGQIDEPYELRKNLTLDQCACVRAGDAIPADHMSLGLYNSLHDCEEARGINADCQTGVAPHLSLWYSLSTGTCYCRVIGTAPINVEDLFIGARVTQEQCLNFCLPDVNGGPVVKTCSGSPPSSWHQFVPGTITYRDGTFKSVALSYVGVLADAWEILDDDQEITRYTLSLSTCVTGELVASDSLGNTFSLQATIVISGLIAMLRFSNPDPSFKLAELTLFGGAS